MNSAVARLGISKAVATFVLLGLAACAAPSENRAAPAVATTERTSSATAALAAPHAELSVAVRAKDDGAGDDPRGILVVGRDVLTRCPQMTGAGAAVGKMAWLGVMRALASCMKDGELRDRAVVLRGPSRPQIIVKYIFTRLGVPEERVAMSSPNGESCVSGDECSDAERRVEVGLVDNATAMAGTP